MKVNETGNCSHCGHQIIAKGQQRYYLHKSGNCESNFCLSCHCVNPEPIPEMGDSIAKAELDADGLIAFKDGENQ